MKRKSSLLLVPLSLLFLAYASPSSAWFESDVDKAKEFMQAGMYPQAIELLKKRINDKPTDAEAHFQLAICFINTGNYGGADERFASALRIKSDYGYQVGGHYKKAGIDALNKGRTGQAQTLLEKAVQYQPDLKKEIAGHYKSVGTDYLNKGRRREALTFFRKAGDYQPNLKKEIAKECFAAGKSYLDQDQSSVADSLFSMAVAYDSSLSGDKKKITQEYGKKLLAIAKEKPKEERKKYVDEALKYLTKEDIHPVLPPPTWKTVFKQEYTGKGMRDKDYVKTVKSGRELFRGDKMIIKGRMFEKYYKQKWRRYTNKVQTIKKSGSSGYYSGVKAPKGEKFTVEIQRLITSY